MYGSLCFELFWGIPTFNENDWWSRHVMWQPELLYAVLFIKYSVHHDWCVQQQKSLSFDYFFWLFLYVSKSQYFFPILSNCFNLLDVRNLQEQVKRSFFYQKLFWPFTVWINCSCDLKNFADSGPSASNFKKKFLITRTFFLTLGQNNFDYKMPI